MAPILPISIKGIVFEDDKVWLRKNERGEWELPGGRLEEGEQPEETVARELFEELGFRVNVRQINQAHVYSVKNSAGEVKDILVITYLCECMERAGKFELEGEAGKSVFEACPIDNLDNLNMPEFYKQAITHASEDSE
jgi:8-oxo-dGTP pyrophosphatase MutT (NUDIX family)